jgi:hypothetical protein
VPAGRTGLCTGRPGARSRRTAALCDRPARGLPDPQYWAARLDNADAPILDRAQIEAQNARMRAQDSHIQDIAALPAQLDAAAVRASITALSSWPTRALYNDKGQAIAPALRSAIEANLGLDAIPAQVAPPTGWW